MTPEELQTQLTIAGITSRIQRKEVLVRECKFCGNERWNLELRPDLGVYQCWACAAGGRLDRLLNEWLGTDVHIPRRTLKLTKTTPTQLPTADKLETMPADQSTVALKYLQRRGLTVQHVRSYSIGVCTQKGHELAGRLIIPLRDFWSGKILGYIGRTLIAGKRPKYMSTLPAKIITGLRVVSDETPCVIVEGAFDAIAVHDRGLGFNVAMLSGVSSPDVQLFAERLPPAMAIAVLLDGEAHVEANRLYQRIQRGRVQRTANAPVVNIKLPRGMDPADFHFSALYKLVTQTINSKCQS